MKEYQIQAQYYNTTDESVLFNHNCVDKIRIWMRQDVALIAITWSLSEKTTCRDCYSTMFRLEWQFFFLNKCHYSRFNGTATRTKFQCNCTCKNPHNSQHGQVAYGYSPDEHHKHTGTKEK